VQSTVIRIASAENIEGDLVGDVLAIVETLELLARGNLQGTIPAKMWPCTYNALTIPLRGDRDNCLLEASRWP
jgi:hypothetical protein